LSFNGTNDYLEAPDQTYLNIGANQDLSIDVWVKISSQNNGVVSLVDKRQDTPIQGYQFFLYNDLLGLQVGNNDNYTNYVSTKAVPADNKWHLVAVTADRHSSSCGSTCGTWYLDGKAVGTFDPSSYDNLTLDSPGIPLRIGAQDASLGSGEFFKGGLDELEIFNRALNATEVQALYQPARPESASDDYRRNRSKTESPSWFGAWAVATFATLRPTLRLIRRVGF
jgi:hypothetical protein